MAWETRRNGKVYYYQKYREGAKVISRYIGNNDLADLLHESQRCINVEVLLQREERHADKHACHEQERAARASYEEIDTIVQQVLAAAGYQRTRGEWRKKRNGRQNNR